MRLYLGDQLTPTLARTGAGLTLERSIIPLAIACHFPIENAKMSEGIYKDTVGFNNDKL